ncbi:MAG TPA: helix-turn-helix transcriptional regulator [Acidimicrobiales bacterium]
MVRKRTGQDDEVPLYFGLTPNQVVAYNLAQARALKGWTQDQAAEALEPHLGARWSSASYSAAERSVDGNRIRNFDADEIVAFARAFELPITWFFLPPPPWASPGVPAKLRTPDAERFGQPLALLADLVFGDETHAATMTLRLQAFLDELGPNPLSDAQQRVTEAVEARKTQLVRHALGDLQQWQTQLRALANHLEDLEHRSAAEPNRPEGDEA